MPQTLVCTQSLTFPTHQNSLLVVATVHKYNQLMKDFPLNELLSATDLDKIQESLILIFGHINRKLKLSPYPIQHALPLIKAISWDFNDQLLCILTLQWLPYTPYDTFKWLLVQTMNIFWMLDNLIGKFTTVTWDVLRKKHQRSSSLLRCSQHIQSSKRGQGI